jgi:hypothetical protein
MSIEELAKRERDSILLFFWQVEHNALDKSTYLLEELMAMYDLGYKQGLMDKNINKED